MFKTTLFALALMAPSVAVAQEAPLCPTVGLLATTIMEARQANAPMSELLDILTVQTTDPNAIALTEAIIMDAYSRPGFGSPANQQRSIDEFRVDMEFACYSATL